MKKDREVLEHNLYKVIQEYANKKNENGVQIKDLVAEKLRKVGISTGGTKKIINKNDPLEIQGQYMIFIITDAFYSATREPIIDPEKFFTEKEIKEYKQFNKEGAKSREKFPLTFKGVKKISDDYYRLDSSIETIKDWAERKLFTYNFDTQRNAKVKDGILMPSINKKSVQEIAERIQEGRFHSNHLTFNLLSNGEEEFKYDSKNRVLTIYNGEMNIIDGFHRVLGILRALSENPESTYVTGINITNFDIDKARDFIVQENKQNPINQTQLKSWDKERMSTIVIEKINTSADSEFKGLVVTDMKFIKAKKGMVHFEHLEHVIDKYFKIKNIRDANNTSKKIVDGLNEIAGCKYDEFKNKDGFWFNTLMVSGYLYIIDEIIKDVEGVVAKIEQNRESLEEVLTHSNRRLVVKELISLFDKMFSK